MNAPANKKIKGEYFKGNIKVRFRNQEDYEEFQRLIERGDLTMDTKGIWYPEDNDVLDDYFE